MCANEITAIVEGVTGFENTTQQTKNRTVMFGRFLTVLLMTEEGYDIVSVTNHLKVNRTSYYYLYRTADGLLETNKIFKKLYLACIAKITEHENDN